jgi:Flp pilus assembly protein TadG
MTFCTYDPKKPQTGSNGGALELRQCMARRGRRMSRSGQHGVAAVEFALLVPILVALLSGIISAGLGYNNVLGVAEGVREGARFGATLPLPWSGTTVQQHTIDATFLNVSGHPIVVTSAMVCTQLVSAPNTVVASSSCDASMPAAPANPAGVVAGTCLVKVWAKIPVTFKFILIPAATVQVNRQSVSIYERGTC